MSVSRAPLTDLDLLYMQHVTDLAMTARDLHREPPFGCLVVGANGKRLARGLGSGSATQPTQHSELIALQNAAAHHGRLAGATLYSTHEPCMMCCGAINHSHISRVVWGSYREDLPHLFAPKIPAHTLLADTTHPPEVQGGVLREQCIRLFDDLEPWAWR